MARVTVEDCIDKVENRFDLVLLASHRARMVSSGAPITIERDNDKNPVVALREIADETISPGDLREDLIDIRPPGLGIEALEDVLAHVGLAGDEVDLVVGALKLPEVTVACDVDEALHGSSVSLVVEDERRRDFIPIPRIVGVILEVALDCAAGGVEGDN